MDRQKIPDRKKLEKIIHFLEKAREAARNPSSVNGRKLNDEYLHIAYGIFGNGIWDVPLEVNNCFTSYILCCSWKANKKLYDNALKDGDKRLEELKRIAGN